MCYHPRIESEKFPSLTTVRSRNSELWLINNKQIQKAILGYAAKFTARYSVKLYALAMEGNHIHSLAEYPKENRAHFQRDFNSCAARAVARYAPTYPGGRLWARRYSNEFVPEREDIEERFFYVMLQPVKDGLVDRLSDYPGYNGFHDAANGITRKFKVVNWSAYHERKRWDSDVHIKDFTQIVELSYKRLPGYEHLSQAEYSKLMHKKLEEHRLQILAARSKPPAGAAALRRTEPGSKPRHTKTSGRHSLRPRILCADPEKKAIHLAWYFDIYYAYKESSLRFRAGELSVEFPPGTYRPPSFPKVT